MKAPTDVVYIDGDILPYQIGFATQRTMYWLSLQGEANVSPLLITKRKKQVNEYVAAQPDILVDEYFMTEDPMQALATLKIHITNIVRGSKCERFRVIMSGDTNFRTDIATIKEYKANRKGTDKPVHYPMLRDWLLKQNYTIVTENEEADDLLSRKMMEGFLGATIDKDLNNTPGWHYNFNKNEIYFIDDITAYKNFYKQMLTGDTADNIPGIRGIGPAKAGKLIDPCSHPSEMEEAVHQAYCETYDNPVEAMTEVGQLLWMRRKENEMWIPKYIIGGTVPWD